MIKHRSKFWGVVVLVAIFIVILSCSRNNTSNPTEPSSSIISGNGAWSKRAVHAGYYWYHGGSRLSCDEVCAARGGCNEAGMALIGSSASDDLCREVLDVLEFPVNSYESGENRYMPHKLDVTNYPLTWHIGCGYASSYVNGGVRLLYYPTNCAANGPDDADFATLYRVCACNQ